MLVSWANLAQAHDMWIAPSSFSVAPQEPVRLYLKLGEAGGETETVARDIRRIQRFSVVAPGGSGEVAGMDGAKLAGVVRPREPGRHAVVYETRPAFIEIPARAFESYLAEEGLEAVIEERRELRESEHPGRELYSRSLKALIDVGETGRPDRAVGVPLELTLQADREGDTTASTGRERTVRLTLEGEPVEGALIRARRLNAAGPTMSRRSDADGRVTFEFGAGSWLVSTVYMERSEDPSAEWRSIWSSLTFESKRAGHPDAPRPREESVADALDLRIGTGVQWRRTQTAPRF